MELEVVGRHVLLFDDDSTSAFVNSPQALVPWNDDASLIIDRYDVRHLLQQIPSRASSSRALQEDSGDGYSNSELDRERYRDLPPIDGEGHDNGAASPDIQKNVSDGPQVTFEAVSFSYGNVNGSFGRKDSDVGLASSGYRPPFPLPESLLNHLPPTEKAHQIIARTAIFVSANGGQSEFVLRVKQGNNPSFGFLMPDHHLHCYFRFLVAHPELVLDAKKSGIAEEQNINAGVGQNESQSTRGVLSMIESVYGSGDDDNDPDVIDSTVTASANVTMTPSPVSTVDHASKINSETKRGVTTLISAKEQKLSLRKNCSIVSISSGASQSMTRPGSSLDDSLSKRDKGTMAETGNLVVEPSMPLRDAINKVVEFIVRNGKEFEEVLIKQDTAHGRFPFLLPNNLYHPYYLKVLQEAYESKRKEKSPSNQAKCHSPRKTRSLRSSQEREASASPPENSTSHFEGLYDIERKAKLKLIDPPRKDSEKLPNEPIKQSGVTADVAAAIVMAATRGLNCPSVLSVKQPGCEKNMTVSSDVLERPLNSSKGDIHYTLGGGYKLNGDLLYTKGQQNSPSDCNLTSGFVTNGKLSCTSLPSSANQMTGSTISTSEVDVANVIAKHVARGAVAANQIDSSESSLTREQKLKAERLKRAKMFAALIKSGQNVKENMLPKANMQRGHEVAASDSGYGSACDLTETDKELVPFERKASKRLKLADTTSKVESTQHASKLEYFDDLTKNQQHLESSSRTAQDDDAKKKKHHHSSHSKDHSSKDEDRYQKRSKSHHHRNYRHYSSHGDEYDHKSHRHKKKYLEDQDDVGSSISVVSKDSSTHITSSPKECQSRRESAQRDDSAEIPDELRAKVRAMLLATL